MKHYKNTITMLLTAAVLLVSVFMTGCTSPTEPKNNTPSGTDAPAESDGFGVYVKLERDDGYLKSDVGFFCFRVFEKGGCSKVLCGVFSFRAVRGKAVAVKFFVGFRRRM